MSFGWMRRTAFLAGVVALSTAFALPAMAQIPGAGLKPEDAVVAQSDDTAIAPQIVGGSAVSNRRFRRNFRWMAALINEGTGRQFCGGALIDPEWVLTAAHCLPGAQASAISVLLDTPTLSSGGDLVPVVQIFMHPQYNGSTNENDIALLQLSRPVDGHPLSLLPTVAQGVNLTDAGDTLRAIGWGDTTQGGSSPDRLREVALPAVAQGTCRAAYPNEYIADTMLCAGRPAGGIDTCQGDSGGPLVARAGDAWVQLGITSWGYGCAQPGLYGVYTRVADYLSWISDTMAGIVTCGVTDVPAPMRLPRDFSCSSLGPIDDGSSGLVSIGFPVRMGAETFTEVAVNNNGNISFGATFGDYQAGRLVDLTLPIIAPFLADVDTRASGSGVVYYGTGRIGTRRAFTAIWPLVGSYSLDAEALNAFQVTLIELGRNSGNFRIEFNYAQIEWDERAAGSTAAPRVGFSLVPDRPARSREIGGSGEFGVLLDTGTRPLVDRSNAGRAGRFQWVVRGGRLR
ncbi:trypsin-like serine protease [Cereibacter sphaeroides]|nr:trypsin-like serine protease [Cereibacter sphaeroides]